MSIAHTDALQISRRYVAAIFALAEEAKKEQTVVDEFSALEKAILAHAELRESLESPMVSHAKKTDLLLTLIAGADAMTRRAVEAVASGGRASLIPVIAGQLREELTRRQGKLDAVVTSARALPAATKTQLQQALAKATGKAVNLTLKEDVRVLGGLKIELGSLQLDATLSGALNHMREQLLATTH